MRSRDTEERLLQAALDLISKRGYSGACTRDIARRAGVSELTLFRHFGTKERLFERMLATHTFLPRLKDLVPVVEDLSCDEALTVIGRRFLKTLKERKALVRINLSEIPTRPAEVRASFTKVVGEITSVLEGYLKRKKRRCGLSASAVHSAPRVFLGALFSAFMLEEIFNGRSLTRRETDRIVEGTVRIILDGLYDPAAAGRTPKEV